MELVLREQNGLSPQAHVFALEELLTIILEYATANATKQELLAFRRVGKLWEKCTNRLFKTPPLKIKMDRLGLVTLCKMDQAQARNQYKTVIPMEITIPPNWVSKTKLIFLQEFSNNVEILHLKGIEGIDLKPGETCFIPTLLPELKTLTVNTQYDVYYGRPRVSEFIRKLVRSAPKLKVFKVIYDEQIVKYFVRPVNQTPFPEVMTHLKADGVIAQHLERLMTENNLRKLECAEIDFMFKNGLSGTVSRIFEQRLVNSKLKKLKLNVQGCMEDFILVYPLPKLEELESNMPMVTFNLHGRTSLSVCFPKLVKLTLQGTQLINLTTFVIEGSKYENLKSLTLRHDEIVNQYGQSDNDTPSMLRRESRLLSKIKQHGFPATPNLVSLEFENFPTSIANVVVPSIFQNSEKLKQLAVSVEDLERFCAHYLRRENNLLRGTTFNLVTSITILSSYYDWKDYSDFIEGLLSIIMTDLKTLRLGKNVRVKCSLRSKWLKSGRNIVGDIKNFILG